MKKLIAVLLLVLILLPNSVRSAETRPQFVQKVYASVALLYKQTEDGGMKMTCTATAYKKLDKDAGYRFVSASHCVSGETDQEQKASKYFITFDTTGEKTFIPASLVMAGDRKVGDDFSIFEVKTAAKLETVPLGDSDKLTIGDAVVNVASPLGLGKQFFQGYISDTVVDRPPLDAGDVQWKDVILVAIGGGPGSSGSSIVSEDQRAIIGFLVGSFGEGSNIGHIVVPVSKFKKFETAVDNHTYKKTPPKSESLKSLF
jgi:hypothetical protein